MENYQSNSNKSKQQPQERPKQTKVIHGNARRQEKNSVQKLSDIFLPEDVGSIKHYILMDVLVPSIQRAIHDVITSTADAMLPGFKSSGKKSNTASRVSYSHFGNRQYDERDARYAQPTTQRHMFDDVSVSTRGEAEDIVCRLQEACEEYGAARVGDLYDMAGVPCDQTYYKYGWTSVTSAQIIRCRDGYIMKMPKAYPI